MIPYGSTVELHAEGALIYIWLPANGSIANPGEATTDATPEVETTYYVIGMNSWGCTDTGAVDITIDYNVNEYLPNSFTPNNDGHNDIFRLGNIKYDKLVDFSIFNRWGELVYHNTYDPTKGWDGYYNGVPQDIGVYNYNIILGTPNGTLKYLKGTVTLIR